jgi:ribonuclease Z
MEAVFFGACGAEPGWTSGNTSFLLRSANGEGGGILVDASGDPVRRLKRAGGSVCDFEAIVLTHTHTDHIYALPSVFHNIRMRRRDRPLALIGNAETLDFARSLLDLFGHLDRDDLPEIAWMPVDPESRIDVGGLRLTFFEAVHSRPCHGFRAEDDRSVVLYSADSGPNPALRRFGSAGCTLIHEATGLHADAEWLNALGHSTARQAGEAARDIKAERLFLCGLNVDTETEVEAYCREAEATAGIAAVFPETDRTYPL